MPSGGSCGFSRNGRQRTRTGKSGRRARARSSRSRPRKHHGQARSATSSISIGAVSGGARSWLAPRGEFLGGYCSRRPDQGAARTPARDLGQAPDPRRRQLQAVAGGVAEIERAAAARPVHLLLDGDAAASRCAFQPSRSCFGDREAGVAGPAARRAPARCGRCSRRVGSNSSSMPSPQLKNTNRPSFRLSNSRPEDLAIEPQGGIQVVDVEDGLEHPIDRPHRHLRRRMRNVHETALCRGKVPGYTAWRPALRSAAGATSRADREPRSRHGSARRADPAHAHRLFLDGDRAATRRCTPTAAAWACSPATPRARAPISSCRWCSSRCSAAPAISARRSTPRGGRSSAGPVGAGGLGRAARGEDRGPDRGPRGLGAAVAAPAQGRHWLSACPSCCSTPTSTRTTPRIVA